MHGRAYKFRIVHASSCLSVRGNATATGNLSLVSSVDLITWKHEGIILTTRQGKWDNATLSTGPSPQQLSDGNWLLLYDIDNLWPVSNPRPIPEWGRCALGWAILDGKNLSNVLGRAEAPLVHAELPWELNGATCVVHPCNACSASFVIFMDSRLVHGIVERMWF
eukprot:SAG31_NODE_7119_length_1784_cov_1.226113_2_plen_164_part_01